MSNNTNTNTKNEGIRDLVAKYLTDGLRKQLLQKGDQLGIQEMRLEVCKAAIEAWGTASSANVDTLYKALTIMFPAHNYTPSRLNCGPCIQQALLKIKNEQPNIEAMIAKLKGAAQPKPLQPTIADHEVKVNATIEPSPANVGQVAFSIQPCEGIFGVLVGMVTQREPVMLFKSFMPINSQPMEANPELVFASPQVAIQKAIAMSDEARNAAMQDNPTKSPTESPFQSPTEAVNTSEPEPVEDPATPVPQPESPRPEPTLPKKGDMLDNGDIQARVISVSKAKGIIALEGDIPEITFEQFAKDWAIVPR